MIPVNQVIVANNQQVPAQHVGARICQEIQTRTAKAVVGVLVGLPLGALVGGIQGMSMGIGALNGAAAGGMYGLLGPTGLFFVVAAYALAVRDRLA